MKTAPPFWKTDHGQTRGTCSVEGWAGEMKILAHTMPVRLAGPNPRISLSFPETMTRPCYFNPSGSARQQRGPAVAPLHPQRLPAPWSLQLHLSWHRHRLPWLVPCSNAATGHKCNVSCSRPSILRQAILSPPARQDVCIQMRSTGPLLQHHPHGTSPLHLFCHELM